MKILKAYINNNDQTVQDFHIEISEKELDGVTAVYFNGFSDRAIAMDFGAAIEMELSDVESWMANWRHKEFWCSPRVGVNIAEVPN